MRRDGRRSIEGTAVEIKQGCIMTDELEEGPDPNDVRRHAKKMLTELEYRKRYRRIDFYRPNPKQLEFHNLIATERMLRAGNQLGKTHAAGAQMTFDALARYPDWYKGRRFEQAAADRAAARFHRLGWLHDGTTTRDGAQTKLLGDIRQQDGLGNGIDPARQHRRPSDDGARHR